MTFSPPPSPLGTRDPRHDRNAPPSSRERAETRPAELLLDPAEAERMSGVKVNLLRITLRPARGAWSGASCTPTLATPSTITMCRSSSASTVPPKRPAQKLLSAVKSAASNTTTWLLIFIS